MNTLPYSKTKEYYKEYRKKNLDKIRKRSREWARKHPQPYYWNEARRETQRRYRLKYKEEIAEKSIQLYKFTTSN